MENVVTGIVFFFLFIYAVLNLTNAALVATGTITDAQLDRDAITEIWQSAQLTGETINVSVDGTTITAVYRNEGQSSLYDFENWDMFVNYYDSNVPANYYVEWLPYTDDLPANNEWTVDAIYHDYAISAVEVYDRMILNHGEEIALTLNLNPAPAPGTTFLITLSTSGGRTAQLQANRNSAPILLTLEDLSLMSHTSADIDNTLLQVMDNESPAEKLRFTVVTEPTQGYLNLGTSFTQTDIDAGLLTYIHTGQGDDFFEFTVSDGEAQIGAYTLNIIATNAPPELAANATIVVASGSFAAITDSVLRVEDIDNDATELIYTVITAPAQGTLSKSPTFTQADIDSGYLTYNNFGTGGDSFSFTVFDGNDTIGTYVFNIQMP